VSVAGQNDGKMRVKVAGLLSSLGFITLPVDDARARRNSRHKVTEAGIGNLIERCVNGWEKEAKLDKTLVKVGKYSFNKRKCTRVELTHPEKLGKTFSNYRNVLYFDRETALPIRVENYDWPAAGKKPELLESFSYINLKLNVGLADSLFKK